MRFLAYFAVQMTRTLFGRAAADAPSTWGARVWVASGAASAVLAAAFAVGHQAVRVSGRARRRVRTWAGDAD